MKTREIHIRDPFVLPHNNAYYLFGTRGTTAWTDADGFDCYVSHDLENWEKHEIFHNDGSFWATKCYWAPECYCIGGAFYLLSTFRSESRNAGLQFLRSDSPTGSFVPYTKTPLTPESLNCIDGTLWFDADNTPWLVFSVSFESNRRGAMAAMPLTSDLKSASGEIRILFEAADAPWAKTLPFAKTEFGIDGDVFLSDGPALHRTQSGRLLMLWSSFSTNGYAVGIAYSDNGRIDGRWFHEDALLFDRSGGHGMIFRDFNGRLIFTCHYPNEKGSERPAFFYLREENDALILEEEQDG